MPLSGLEVGVGGEGAKERENISEVDEVTLIEI